MNTVHNSAASTVHVHTGSVITYTYVISDLSRPQFSPLVPNVHVRFFAHVRLEWSPRDMV